MGQVDIARLLERLEARHRWFAEESMAVCRAIEQAPDASDRVHAVCCAFSAAVRFHIQREEQFLFPGILALLDGDDDGALSVRGTISTLELEHEELLELEARLRGLVDEAGTIGPRLVTLLDDFEAHNEAEDGLLFPAVQDLVQRRHIT